MTCKQLPTNKCFAAKIFYSCVIQTTLSCLKMADRFPELLESDLTSSVDQKNSDRIDKTIIELGYCKIS